MIFVKKKRKIEISLDRESTYKGMKKEFIESLEEEVNNPNISDAYKKSRIKYVIREMEDINDALGLPSTDGVEKWLENKE